MDFNANAEREHAGTRATCKRCGANTVVWRKAKSGRYYLCEVFIVGDEEFTNYKWFHSMFCTSGPHAYDHDEIQDEFEHTAAEAEEKRLKLRTQREQEKAETNAMEFMQLVLAPEDERREKLASLEREQASYERNPPTMDYMVEFMRETAAAKVRVRNIAILRASLGMIEEEV